MPKHAKSPARKHKPVSYALPHNASLEQVKQSLASVVKCLALGHGTDSQILSAMSHARSAIGSLEMWEWERATAK